MDSLTKMILPPDFKEGSYENYKKELDVWKLMKTCGETEQGPIVFRSLTGRAKTAVNELTVQQIGSATGLELILGKLDSLYLPDENQRVIAALDKFESYKRAPNVNMSYFLLEFERLHSQLTGYGITYPDGVLAYRVMKAAGISSEHEQLLRATVTTGKWSYASVVQQLKKIFNDITAVRSRDESTPTERAIKVEQNLFNENTYPQSQECYYSNNNYDDYDVIHYENFTDTDDCESSFPQTNYNKSEPQEHDIYYGPSRGTQPWNRFNGRSSRGRNYQGQGWKPTDRQSFQNPRGFQKFGDQAGQQQSNSNRHSPFVMNPKDYRGYPTVCRKCRSTYHYWENCPHVSQQEKMNASKKVLYGQNNTRYDEDLYIALFQKSTPTTVDEMVCLMSETLNKAVIDSGCTKTCAGERWYDAYLETLTDKERKEIQSMESQAVFRFGDSPPVSASKKVLLPIKIMNVDILLETEIVSSDVPLLLSKETMKKAKAKMNFDDDKIELFGEEQPMMCTSTGHYAIPIQKNNLENEINLESNVILFGNQGNADKNAIAKKLHTQFGHPSSKRLIKLIENSGKEDKELKQAIEELSNKCDICKRYKKSRPKPVVSFPLATEFNETVAMDLKVYKNNCIYFLHIIDHATRLSQAAVIRSKKGEVVLKQFMMSWVAIFGCPQKVLSDNGGEFANAEFVEMCENLNINFMTTAAESPWSNGLIEKHNQSVGEAVDKIEEDIHCSVEVALCWAINAKNSLQNIYGFSPYQLVFGKNPNLPSVLNNKLPALEGVSKSQLVADMLNALHSARREVVKLESSEKIRRALRAQTRTHSNVRYITGDDVFYKREDERRWRGPGRVVGQDGSKVLIKIPTGLISVHSCNVMLTSDAETKRLEGGKLEIENSNEEYQSNPDQNENLEVEEMKSYVEPNLFFDKRITRSQNQENNVEVETSYEEQVDGDNVENIQLEEIGDIEQARTRNEEQVNNDNLENIELEEIGESIHEQINDDNEHNLNESDAVNAELDTEINEVEVDKENVVQREQIVEPKVNTNSGLPKAKQTVKFRETDDDEWKKCIILSRWGSIPGHRKVKHFLNIRNLDDNTERCIDWEKGVKEWTPIEEEVLVTSSQSDYKEEMENELQNWKKLNVYDEVDNEGQDFITVRWVYSEKEVGEKKVRKARLVARGYQEVLEKPTDSPTCNTESQRVALAVISSEGWDVHSLDVKAAFLQGKAIDRDLYLKPPREAGTPGKLWKLKRCVYGLNDASRFWYFRVTEELNRLGCKKSTLDSSLYIYYTDKLEGILISHVDDFLFAGTENFHKSVIMNLKETFKISKEDKSNFKYIGIELQQSSNGIYATQEKYLDKLQEIEISSSRYEEKGSPINDDERSKLRSCIGQLSWLATRTRPDLSYDVCNLSTNLKNGTVDLIMKTNKVIKKAKYNTVFLHFPKLDLKNLTVKCYADASYGNLPDGGSQGGVYVELVDSSMSAPIQWQSKRLKRTPKSTLAAETIAMVEGMESAYLTSKLLSEILYNSTKDVPVEAVTDCYSLFEAAHSTTCIEDKRLRIELSILRESLLKNEFKLSWVNTGNQLADCLTKSGSNPRLLIERITGKKVL